MTEPNTAPESHQHVQRLSRLIDAIKAISVADRLEEVVQTAAAASRALVGADGAGFALLQDEQLRWVAEDAVSPRLRGRQSEALAGRAIRSRQPELICGDLPEGLASLLLTPVRQRAPIGAIGVYWSTPWTPTGDEVALLQSLAESAAVKLGQLEADAELERRVRERTAALQAAREAAEAASRAKSAFLANMSHELRTPLNAVMGYAQILERDLSLSRPQRESAEAIHRSGEHLLTLINDILDLARIEADRLELNPDPLAWPEFLADVADLFRLRARQKGLSFTYQIGSALPEGVVADETRLRQVLINLLGNAVKFTAAGGVTFRVSEEDGMSRLEIADTGPGIPLADQDIIFKPFRQAGPRRSQIEGTGLGLTITRRLVEMMGGTLLLESRPGRGSTFTLLLPLVACDVVARPARLGEHAPIIGYEGATRRILVVDDQQANREIVRMVLEPLGFIVEEAVDGLDGLERARALLPDAIILDLVMPRMDGFEALRQLRADPDLARTSVLVTSASAFATDQQRSEDAGGTAFLSKPVRIDVLLTLLQEQLGLQWRHAREALPEPPPRSLQPEGVLSGEEAAVLIGLARRGDVAALLEWATTAAARLPMLAAEVRGLAGDFDLEGIAALARARERRDV